MAKQRIFDLPETRGAFQLKGIVTGTEKDGFYKEMKTQTHKDMRIINFGIEYAPGKTLYVNMIGVEQENVYFSKKAEKKGEKSDTVKIPWSERFNYKREGYRLIGKNIGVKKKIDSDGKTVNDKKNMTEFDACKEVGENLKDGASVFVKGRLDYSSFEDDNGNKKMSVKLIPDQISLCGNVNFEDSAFKQQNDFNQVIMFMGIEKEKDDNEKETGRFEVSAKIVTYKTIEDAEFIIVNPKLAGTFRKKIKPYDAVKAHGQIITSVRTETVEDDDDEWGESDALEKVKEPVKREFLITGADKNSIDRELYSIEKVEEAIQKIAKSKKAVSDFGEGSDDDWGNISDIGDDEEIPWK